MKKLFFLVATLVCINSYAQITLENTFAGEMQVYNNASETYYYSSANNGAVTTSGIKIYNSDYTLRSQFTINLPTSNSGIRISPFNRFTLSKNIFNTDNLLEIVVNISYSDSSTNTTVSIIRVYNENGDLVKDFGAGYRTFLNGYDFTVFHDNTSRTNKLLLYKSSDNTTQIYNLNTNTLAAKEVVGLSLSKIFPNPTSDFINITTDSKIISAELFDVSGKIVLKSSDKKINISALPKGNYFLKVKTENGENLQKIMKI